MSTLQQAGNGTHGAPPAVKTGMKRADTHSRAITILLIISLAAASAVLAADGGFPRPPKGFSWKRFGAIQAAFLVPRGWHVKEKKSTGARTVFITRDKMGKDGSFATGFSLDAVKDIPAKYDMPPSEYASILIERMQADRESKGVGPSPEHPRFKGAKGFFRSGPEQQGRVVQYAIALGNDATGTFYMVTFESPEAEWDGAWKTGAVIMNNLLLDEKY